jgi:hypothetical protein
MSEMDGKPGTDIYILGFLDSGDWKQDIVSKVLESFMAAVVFGSLEVRVDDIVVNKGHHQANRLLR